VVESQKARLIDELQKAITRLGIDSGALAALETARDENQFGKAIETMAMVINASCVQCTERVSRHMAVNAAI